MISLLHSVRCHSHLVLLVVVFCTAAELPAAGGEGVATPPVPVTTSKLADLVFFPERTAPATVVSVNNAGVSAEISGLLLDVSVNVGDEVLKAATIARIDCRDAETDLAQAEAEYKASQAKHQYDESQLAAAKKLSASNSISSEESDRRKSNERISAASVDKTKAEVSRARLAVSRCDIKAPFNAVVVERLASIGDFLNPGSPVARLVDTDTIEVSARIQEIDLDSVRGAAEYFFDSQGRSYPVQLRTVLPVMDSRLRSYETRFLFTGTRTSPGSAGRLRWRSPRPHLPAELLVQREAKLGVFMVRDGRAAFVPLPESQPGKPAVVDLDPASEVVLDGRFILADGDALTTSMR